LTRFSRKARAIIRHENRPTGGSSLEWSFCILLCIPEWEVCQEFSRNIPRAALSEVSSLMEFTDFGSRFQVFEALTEN
jgi:hypothetical protein